MKTPNMLVLEKAMERHINNAVPLTENVFRAHSENNYALFSLARKMVAENKYSPKTPFEKELLEETDIGEFDVYEGKSVPLDYPLEEAEEKVELNKPKRGGPKKFYVFVKDPSSGNVKKVSFGDPGMSVNFDDLEARKSFAARHDCAAKKDKTTPGYWSCRLPSYAASLGLSNGGSFYW